MKQQHRAAFYQAWTFQVNQRTNERDIKDQIWRLEEKNYKNSEGEAEDLNYFSVICYRISVLWWSVFQVYFELVNSIYRNGSMEGISVQLPVYYSNLQGEKGSFVPKHISYWVNLNKRKRTWRERSFILNICQWYLKNEPTKE